MPKMIALKKFHYPSGVHGKNYNIGDEVDVKTDRDAKALRLLKVAKDPPTEASKPAPAPKERSEEPAEPRRRYKRADMAAEGGND